MGDIAERRESEIKAREAIDSGQSKRFQRFKEIRNMIEEEYRELDHRQISYLAALSVTGKVIESARIAGITRDMVRGWRKGKHKNLLGYNPSELFTQLEEVADQHFDEMLLDEVDRRALEGVKEDVFYKGEKVGEKTKYSDNLLMFRVKARMPEYKDSTPGININSEGNGDVNISFELPEMNKSLEEAEVIEVDYEDELE